jgi:NADPH:quinone reductase-like Zn-dependent oxidoreductase
VLAGGSMPRIFQLMFISMTGTKNMVLIVAKINQEDLLFIKELLEAGKIKPFIDKRYPLNEVADALWYLKKGHARGKVVITV